MRNLKLTYPLPAGMPEESGEGLEHRTAPFLPMLGVTLLVLDLGAVVVTLLMAG